MKIYLLTSFSEITQIKICLSLIN